MNAERLRLGNRDGRPVAEYENQQGEMMDGAVLKQGKEGTIPGVLPMGAVFDGGKNYMYAYVDLKKPFSETLKAPISKTVMTQVLYAVASTLVYLETVGIPMAYAVLDPRYIYLDETGYARLVCIPSRSASMQVTGPQDFFRGILAGAKYTEDTDGYVARMLTILNGEFSLDRLVNALRDEMEKDGIEFPEAKTNEPKAEGPALSAVVAEEKQGETPAEAPVEEAAEEAALEVEEVGAEMPAEPKEPSLAEVVAQEIVVPEAVPQQAAEVVPEAVPQQAAEVVPEAVPQQAAEVVPEAVPQQAEQVVPEVAPQPQQASQVTPQPVPQQQPMQAEPQPAPQPEEPRRVVPMGVVEEDEIVFEEMPEELSAKINKKNLKNQPAQQAQPQQQAAPQVQPQQQAAPQMQQAAPQVQPQQQAAPQPVQQAAPQPINDGPRPMISPEDAGLAPKTPRPHLVQTRTGTWIDLPDGEFVIGKSANGTDYMVDNSAVSRQHCTISKRNGVFYVKDNGSTNGTKLNNEKVEGAEKLLTNGAKLMLGNEEFIFNLW